MSPKPLIDLRKSIRAKLAELLGDDGLTTGQLALRVREDHASAVEAARDELAHLGLQRVIQDVMHKPHGRAADARQGTISFPATGRLANMKAPDMISVPTRSNGEADEVRWMPFRRARLTDLKAHLDLLKTSMRHDRIRAGQIDRAIRYFEPRMKGNTQMTVEDVLRGQQP